MNHETFEELLAAQTLNVINREDHSTLEAHLASGCSTCQELKISFGNVLHALPESVEGRSVPPHLKAKILKQIERPEPT